MKLGQMIAMVVLAVALLAGTAFGVMYFKSDDDSVLHPDQNKADLTVYDSSYDGGRALSAETSHSVAQIRVAVPGKTEPIIFVIGKLGNYYLRKVTAQGTLEPLASRVAASS